MHFQSARIPPLFFGPGRLSLLPALAREWGPRMLLLTGARSFLERESGPALLRALAAAEITVTHLRLEGEPTTEFIDTTCAEFSRASAPPFDVVVGIGGGSVIDGAKALSAMLPLRGAVSVLDFLEDVGRGGPHPGCKIPYIAVPTTSGTGGEVTKNAVISQIGEEGYKKSLRHENLVPDRVIVDPELLLGCPPAVTAACGMDAFTQLLEPYLSPQANPLTDAWALSGLEQIRDNLHKACGAGAEDLEVRAAMAYGSLMSGLALANAGLGIVHGLASPLGGFFPIPHGVVCGTLVAEATRANIRALREAAEGRRRGPDGAAPKAAASEKAKDSGAADMPAPGISRPEPRASLRKYAQVGGLLTGLAGPSEDYLLDALVAKLEEWTETLKLPRLSAYGVEARDIPRIVERTKNRHNPIALSPEEMAAIVEARL